MSRAIAIAALVFLALGPLGAFAGLLPPIVGFGLHALGGALGLVAAIWAGVSWLRKPKGRDFLTVLLALPAIVALIIPAIGVASHPRINDITSDLADPPALAVAPEYPEPLAAIVAESYPDLKTLIVESPPKEAFDHALSVARSRERWEITTIDGEALVFQGVATTALFRFRDDFAVRVRPAPDNPRRAAIDMRSKSRDGKSDLGVNAKRIRAFFAALQE